jgi:hypothetical protein
MLLLNPEKTGDLEHERWNGSKGSDEEQGSGGGRAGTGAGLCQRASAGEGTRHLIWSSEDRAAGEGTCGRNGGGIVRE